MPNQQNVEQVENIRENFQNSEVIILTEYQGLTVAEMNELRDKLREAEIRYKVYKNKLINVVAQELGIEGVEPYLRETTGVAMSNNPAASAKILEAFGHEHEHLKIKAGILGTRVIDAVAVGELVNMPSKDQLIALAVGGLKAPISGLVNVLHQGSPLTGLVNVLKGSIRQVTTVLQAIADQKKEAEA
ncbi:MAG: 50S ribosomal protein L10 [Candidatus Poribacteria bacterium]|nr:50S ribosomal protein L10 [Candidatus Poribacteria bacterium]